MTDDRVERGLAAITEWEGPTPGLWARALESGGGSGGVVRPRGVLPVLGRPIPNGAIAAVLALIFVVAVFVSLPSLGGRARMSALRVESSPPPASAAPAAAHEMFKAPTMGLPSVDTAQEPGVGVRAWPSQAPDGIQRPREQVAARFVVRKATIEIETADVASAFAKAVHSVSAAQGEYVQDSSLSGEGRHARASLTLRVAADRLGEALTELRGLGAVASERSSGEDVTAQMVDLEARLRNEQRVEKELLELLEKRGDAPLKEVLELRQALSGVRESIEQMSGQREHLSRLVSLATVLVIIRTGDVPEAVRSGLGDYFLTNIARAWGMGLTALADSVAAQVRVAVGGLVWWVVLAVAIGAAVRWRRRRLARGV